MFFNENFFTLFDLYYKLVMFVLLLSLISFVLLNLSRKISFFFYQDLEKITEYECGFEPFDNATRQPFDIQFFIVGILFLIFDVEISLLFPWALSLLFSSVFAYWTVFLFLIILTIGLFFEWKLDAIDWPYHETSK